MWRYEFVENMNVHALHAALAHQIDLDTLKAVLRKGTNAKQL